MGTWRGTGRRALAVGAGALLIGALGAGPAYAGSGNDDDDYASVDDSCSDYHYSWYFEHGYDYDQHWDDDSDHGDHDRWNDHDGNWDHGKDWHQGDDWKKHWDENDYYVKDGKVYDKKTNEPVFDLGGGKPLDVQGNNVPLTAPDPTSKPEQADGQARADEQARQQAAAAAEKAEQQAAAEKAQEQAQAAAEKAQQRAQAAAEKAQQRAQAAAQKAQQQAQQAPSTSTTTTKTTPTVEIPTENKAVVTDLATTDPWDDKDKDHDRDSDRDKDDHWWDGWWEKESYTVKVTCYEDKETHQRWYDDRPVGKVEATEVKTVPTGGVNTGN